MQLWREAPHVHGGPVVELLQRDDLACDCSAGDDQYAFGTHAADLSDAEPGTFYLTDFLVRHFDRLVVEALGLGRHPELTTDYFRHYRRVVYLSQRRDEKLELAARAIAERLQLEYIERFTGYGELATSLAAVARMPGTAGAIRVVSPSWPR
jgi:hypothetical protein